MLNNYYVNEKVLIIAEKFVFYFEIQKLVSIFL